MKKIWITITIVVGSILIGGFMFAPGLVNAHTSGGGMTGQGMMGYGMMGQEQNMFEDCEKMMDWVTDRKPQAGKALVQEDAVSIVENYLEQTRNPNLTIGEVEGREDGDYLVEIVTKDGSLVDKLEVNRLTGWIHSIYAE